MNEASRAQNDAADPRFSAWLSANAGSGKTSVLTNRVALLLLNGAEPQNILCLTYTRAAASEMQNRLFRTLGKWAMLDDEALGEALGGVGQDIPHDLQKARTLFARAIEAPGGLKIQTIHALCATILRRFPLEAGVSPQFRELDERQQLRLVDTVIAEMAAAGAPALAEVSRVFSGESLAAFGRDVAGHADAFAEKLTRATIFEAFGVPPNRTEHEILGMALAEGDIAFLKGLVPTLDGSGGTVNGELARKLESLPDTAGPHALDILEDALLTKESKFPYSAKIGSLPTGKGFRGGAFSPFLSRFNAIMERVAEARKARVAYEAATTTAALHHFADTFLPAYAAAKAVQGVLDFDDLIRLTRTLLDNHAAAWVRYRIDSRIDHVLVDEAQDTSPDQWRIVEALAGEIAFDSRGGLPRSLFVVGDRKQSIYSFQGADAAGFDRMAEKFGLALAGGLKRRELRHSFRSSPAILSAVDATMAGLDAGGAGPQASHIAFYDAMPGRVDLWPFEVHPVSSEEPDWHDPVDRPVANAAPVVLADKIAGHIRTLIETEAIPDKNGRFRPVEPGDILILVQRRSVLFDQIIRACKANALPTAGADRLKIGAELAVRDVLALFAFLALPEDDLSLAAALRSPLFGWTERELYGLAQPRPQGASLWSALLHRTDEFPETVRILRDLRDISDYSRPYELLERVLTRYEGRRKLLARLGPEAEDGINEICNQALAYERDDVPSLTGFLQFALSGDAEIKRPADASDNRIRVMTVHGAKGLERPVVILPDTVPHEVRGGERILRDPGGMPVLPIPKPRAPDRIRAAKDASLAADREERNRLLYVAMTRAETWLIVAGIAPWRNAAKVSNWHDAVEAGLRSAGAGSIETPTGTGLRLEYGHWPPPEVPRAGATSPVGVGLPSVLASPNPPVASEDRRPLSPSALGGAKIVGGGAREEAEALRRGRQIHLLLQHLANTDDPEALARRLLAGGSDPAGPDEIPGLVAEARRVLAAHPALFAGDALEEVDVTAFLPTLGRTVAGAIDRLVTGPDRILAIDFKTNAVIPGAPEDIPEGLLRQMGAYLEALEGIWPDRPVEVAILWTATAELMTIPHGIVRAALARTTTS